MSKDYQQTAQWQTAMRLNEFLAEFETLSAQFQAWFWIAQETNPELETAIEEDVYKQSNTICNTLTEAIRWQLATASNYVDEKEVY